jgi:hypothetical protein
MVFPSGAVAYPTFTLNLFGQAIFVLMWVHTWATDWVSGIVLGHALLVSNPNLRVCAF